MGLKGVVISRGPVFIDYSSIAGDSPAKFLVMRLPQLLQHGLQQDPAAFDRHHLHAACMDRLQTGGS
jgi:hypothetical protein